MDPGTLFEGRYRITRRLGRGGFADVYLGTHVEIGQKVAIKVLRKQKAEPRFVREGQVLASLKSASTLRVLDFGRTADSGEPFLITEYLEGETVATILLGGPVEWQRAVAILDQILDSLPEAHAAGIVHRDIKPDNVMVLPSGDVKVLDFGIAGAESSGGTITGTGVVIGTPRYMAPEALLGSKGAKPSVDVFAVGLLGYSMLTGTEANQGQSTDEILMRHMSPEPYLLPENIGIPSGVRRVIERLCEKDPDRRPPDAAVARAALHRALSAEVPDPTGDRQSSFPVATAAVAAVLVVSALGIVLASSTRAEPETIQRSEPEPGPRARVTPIVLAAPEFADDTHVAAAFDRGRKAFDDDAWVPALSNFSVVLSHPDSVEADVLVKGDYVRRAIDALLGLEDSAAVRNDLRTVATMFPGDVDLEERLREIEAGKTAAPVKTTTTKRAPTNTSDARVMVEPIVSSDPRPAPKKVAPSRWSKKGPNNTAKLEPASRTTKKIESELDAVMKDLTFE